MSIVPPTLIAWAATLTIGLALRWRATRPKKTTTTTGETP